MERLLSLQIMGKQGDQREQAEQSRSIEVPIIRLGR
jgi:hypothetical protein